MAAKKTTKKPARRNAPARRSAPRSNGNGSNGYHENGGGNGESKGVRVTGFFRTRTPGLWTGRARAGEEVERLMEVLNEAAESGQDVAFFLRRRNDGNGIEFSLGAQIDDGQRRGGNGGGNRRNNYGGNRGRSNYNGGGNSNQGWDQGGQDVNW